MIDLLTTTRKQCPPEVLTAVFKDKVLPLYVHATLRVPCISADILQLSTDSLSRVVFDILARTFSMVIQSLSL